MPLAARGDDYNGFSSAVWLLLTVVVAMPLALTGPASWLGAVVEASLVAVPASMALLRGVYDGVGRRRGYTRGGWPWVCMYGASAAGAVAALQP